MTLLLALVLALPCAAPRDSKGFRRDPAVRAAFMRANPCPGGPDKGSVKRCKGYEAHHVVPLFCGGRDEVSNLAWLAAAQHQALHRATTCKQRCEVVK